MIYWQGSVGYSRSGSSMWQPVMGSKRKVFRLSSLNDVTHPWEHPMCFTRRPCAHAGAAAAHHFLLGKAVQLLIPDFVR